jgi:acyl-homoserine-lactone acylase
VLNAWDRRTDASSRGAVLFESFWRAYLRQRGANASPFDIPWQPGSPFTTPDGLSDPAAAAAALDAAAEQIEARFGSLNVAWGDAHRLRRGNLDLPAAGGPGGLGIFRVLGFSQASDGMAVASSGNTWIAAIEFSQPVRASVLLTYGNASQPGSTHRADQLPLFARKVLREAWRTRADIQRHLARHDRF